MFRPRVIPVLLLKDLGLTKSIKFKNHKYIGDPINAVKIFNEKKTDELVFLDILASKEKRCISLDFVRKVGDEANMPFAVGGGIRTRQNIRDLLINGAEKVVLNSIAIEKPEFVKEVSEIFGSSTIVVCIDVKKDIFGRERIAYYGGSRLKSIDLIEYSQQIAEYGAGELIIQSIDRDGSYEGYDLDLVKRVSISVTIPVIALGGAGCYSDFYKAVHISNASAVAAGSIFVYHGPRRAVLISFPSQKELSLLFNKS